MVWPIVGNGNAKQANWQKSGAKGSAASITSAMYYDLQRQITQMQWYGGNGNWNGKGKGKGDYTGKGKGKSSKGPGKGWFTWVGDVEVLRTDQTKARWAGHQAALDKLIAKQKAAAEEKKANGTVEQPAAPPVPNQHTSTKTLRRELLANCPAPGEAGSPVQAQEAEQASTEEYGSKTLRLLGIQPLPTVSILDALYPVPRPLVNRKTAEQAVNEMLAGSPSGGVAAAKTRVDSVSAAVENLRHSCASKEVKASLAKELQDAKTALDSLDQSTPTAAKAKIMLMQAMEKATDSTKERAAGATKATSSAGILHRQSLAAVDKFLVGLTDMRTQIVSRYEESQKLWRDRNETLETEAANLLTELKARLQAAEDTAKSAMEVNVSNTANIAMQVQGDVHPSVKNVNREFMGDVADIPNFIVSPAFTTNAEAINRCGAIWACLKPISFLDPMPTATFEMIELEPSDMHSIVGDSLWEACWDQEHPHITMQHYIPFKMLKAVKHIMEVLAPETVRNPSYQQAGVAMQDRLLAEKVRLQAQ